MGSSTDENYPQITQILGGVAERRADFWCWKSSLVSYRNPNRQNLRNLWIIPTR
jgi:hypothetical protein